MSKSVAFGVAAAVLVQEFAFALHHAVWSDPWWRDAFLWSDRWHILSFFAHWPLATAATFYAASAMSQGRPTGRSRRLWSWGTWAGIAAGSWILWQVAKAIGGRSWPSQASQIGTWLDSLAP